MKTLRVELGHRSYPIVVGSGAARKSADILAQLGFATPPFVISNTAVVRLHGKRLRGAFAAHEGLAVQTIGDGERFKSHATLLKIYDNLFRRGADRRSWLLAFGGGVVGDIAGFAAATFMRGIPYANIPTTLLAQVDSSIGGKVGINVRQGKNLVGAFHQPSAVISDTDLLRTLPARELASGLFEVIKTGAIRSEPLVAYVEQNLTAILKCRPEPLEHIVQEAARIKAAVVAQDERETESRMILNYGHTIGHALEAATQYRRFKHGEAVAWGMIAAIRFGRELGFMPESDAVRLIELIRRVEPLPSLEGVDPAPVWLSLKRDKKFRSGSIRMVLLPRIGDTEVLSDIDAAALRRFIRRFLQRGGGSPHV